MHPQYRPPVKHAHTAFGALDAGTGQLHYAIRSRKLAIHFVAFLEQLTAAYPTGAVVSDSLAAQDAQLVRAWLAQPGHARFPLLWLPKYGDHVRNPIARAWGLVKDAVAANRLHGSIEARVATAVRFLDTTTFTSPAPTLPVPTERAPQAA
jgi:hypothetical protein